MSTVPIKEIRKNIIWFKKNVLCKLSKLLLEKGVVYEVVSLYRTKEMNDLIGGSETSQHLIGLAADLKFSSQIELPAIVKTMGESNIPYSKIVIEDCLGASYLHISSDKKSTISRIYEYDINTNSYILINEKPKEVHNESRKFN